MTVVEEACDPLWLAAHKALPAVHAEKSSTYGHELDRFANFTAVGAVSLAPRERYALLRMIEKATRALNMIDSGHADDVEEYPDIASLALCCEAMRRHRVNARGLLPLDEPLPERRAA